MVCDLWLADVCCVLSIPVHCITCIVSRIISISYIIRTYFILFLLLVIELITDISYFITSKYLLGITLIFFSLHSYDSLCQRGSELVLVIRLIQLY